MDQDLVYHYENTTYRVTVSGQQFDLKIGHHHEPFEHYCQAAGIRQWAIITAFNPYSRSCPEAENHSANHQLQQELIELGFAIHSGDGVPSSDSDWKTEEGFFITNISIDKAIALGEKYRQNAIVVGEVGRVMPPNLVNISCG